MKKWSLVIILACAQFIMVLDSTVMNVSISAVVKDLDTTVSGLQAAITFYTLTMAALMMTGGKMGDIWGRIKAFRIGAIVYALGSLLTALTPSLAVLMIGWSLIEGLGAVLVIPAIAALIALHYRGKDRVVGYTLIGAASGIAVAAGPLIGGYLTTYLSWRYVFAGETLIMAAILFLTRKAREKRPAHTAPEPIDVRSVLLSASGMAVLIFGILQSKTWGWITPKAIPQIGGIDIAPFGISIVAYLIILGIIILRSFDRRQRSLETAGHNPLLRVSLFGIKPLRSGLAVLSSQYLIIAAVFFVLPIYLQLVLGLNALDTGKKIFPLSVAIVVFSVLGSRLISRFSPKQIVRLGQLLLVAGALSLLGAIGPELNSALFGIGMLVLGSGLGLLASQIGNVTMSSVGSESSSEVGGLQGTFQNLGSSLGTALIGSVIIAGLSANLTSSLAASSLPPAVTQAVESQQQTGIPIVPASTVEQAARQEGLPADQAADLASLYQQSQIDSLKSCMFVIALLGLLSIYLSRNIPARKLV